MKSIYRIFITVTIVASMLFALSSCDWLDTSNDKADGTSESNTDKTPSNDNTPDTNNPTNPDVSGDSGNTDNTDSEGGENNQGGTGDDNQGGTGDDSQGGTGDDNQGGTGDDNQGGAGDDNQGGTGDDNQGGAGDDNQGGTGDDNQGGTGDDNQGGTGDDSQGGTGDDNQGGTGDDNQGGSGDDNQGGSGDDNQGSTGDDNQGGTGDDNQGGTCDDNQGGTGDDNQGGTGDDGEQDDEVIENTEKNTIETTYLPYYNYGYASEGAYNKELFYQNSYDVALGDPTVFPREENGVMWFYVTGTTTGSSFEMWKTRDFAEWIKIGTVYSPSENFFGKSSFWAPQLYYDAEADWQYYLGKDSDNGKGLYILFFSARRKSGACAVSVAFSKNIEGPYTNFVGTNANGDYIDESNSLFEIEELKGLGLYANHIYGDLYKKNRSFIDACPFIDPKTNEKYLYMVRNRNVDKSNDVWGFRLKDWVTPDYMTTTPLTSYGYIDIEKSAEYEYKATSNIDEGPFLYYKDFTDDGIKNGKYYLTFSIGGTNDKLYPVCQAVSDSPLGPFTKIQPSESGFINCPELFWDIHGSGHHAFFELNGELYIAYHTYEITNGNSIGRRYFAFDKVMWTTNESGQYVMRSNGPTTTIQPLPSAVSGYENSAKNATVTVNGEATDILNDGIIALRKGDEERLYSYTEDIEILIEFDEYITARSIIVYNSYNFTERFHKVDKIELSYRKMIDGRIYYGTAIIDSLEFNQNNNRIPAVYLEAAGESNMYQLRSGCSAIAEFAEIEINAVKIYMYNRNGNVGTSLSEILILGKSADNTLDESFGLGGYTVAPSFESYTAFGGSVPEDEKTPEDRININGILDDEIWTELATVTEIAGATIDSVTKQPVDVSLYGERSAKVYTYIGERKIYFAFDVTDKNLFFNASQPQGRSTCVEIYFTTEDNTNLRGKCYSIRINPMGSNGSYSCNVGIYVPNSQGNEWARVEIAHTVVSATVVRGSVQTSKNSEGYDSSLNTGYTVEIAIDKILIGLEKESIRFTAAFVQDRGYAEDRIGNTFIPGTHYVKPETWIVFKNKDS